MQRTAVVTGGGSGIGREVSKELLEERSVIQSFQKAHVKCLGGSI